MFRSRFQGSLLASAFFAMCIASVASAQTAAPSAEDQMQTPLQRTLLPFLQEHSLQPLPQNTVLSMSSANYVTPPNFGGYLNAPYYPARTTASVAAHTTNNGVAAEASGDFNKDGRPDLAVLQFDGTLNVLINNGSGAFPTDVTYSNPNYLTTNIVSMFAVDVNGDGFPDIVGYDTVNAALIVWINLGNGTFNAAQITPISTANGSPAAIAIADVNGDGKVDVVAASVTAPTSSTSNLTVQTLLGKGDGTFTAAGGSLVQTVTIPLHTSLMTHSIALGDLNGDGKPDVAVLLEEQITSTSGTLAVTTALNNGGGSFTTLNQTVPIAEPVTSQLRLAFSTSGVQILDLNGDKKGDVVADSSAVLYTATGLGNGSFNTPVSSPYTNPTGEIFADVNGDGIPDAISANGWLSIWLGKGDGTFSAPAVGSEYVTDPANGVAIGDFDADGNTDISILGSDYKNVSIYFGSGKGTFRGAPLLTSSTNPYPIFFQVQDALKSTTSGFSDVIVLNQGVLLTGVSDGKGNFSYANSLTAGLPTGFSFVEPVQADFNGDGKQDLLLAGTKGAMWVALSNGDGTFQTPVALNMPTLACAVGYAGVGDLNGDGKSDIVVAYAGDSYCSSGSAVASGYYVMLGNGDGTFGTPAFHALGKQMYSATLADMNKDGKLDVLLDDVPTHTGSGYALYYEPGNGDGTFGTSVTVLANYVLSDVLVGDINQDGKPDLVLTSEEVSGNTVATGSIVIIPGNGDGTFGAPSQIAQGNFFIQAQLTDVNGDGIPDIEAVLDQTNGQPNVYYGMSTMLGLGNGQFSAPYNSLESLASTNIFTGNFYNDSAPDLVVQTSYGTALYLGQGGNTIAVTASASTATFGQSETFTATVTSSISGRPAATGTVSFYDGSTLLGTSTLNGGKATFTTSALTAGTHTITAVYGGDSNYNASTSAGVTVMISALAPAFTLSGTPTSVSVTAGGNGVVTLSLAANASFSGTVNLTCSGAPTNASCSINPASVSLTTGSTAQATLIIGTTGTKAELSKPFSTHAPVEAALCLSAGLMLMFWRRKSARKLGMLAVALLLSTGVLLSGCSGGGGPTVPSTGPTSFTITVTATPSSGAAATQTATISVSVQ